MPQWEAVQDSGRLELAEAGSKLVGSHSEFALEIAVTLRPVEQLFHDEQGPPRSDYFEGGGEIAHAVGSASGFIQNGE